MTEHYTLEIRVQGEKFDPAAVSLKKLGEFLEMIETVIAPIVRRDNPSLVLGEDDVVVSVASITKGSFINVLETKYPVEVTRAAELAAQAIVTGDYSSIPVISIRGLQSIRTFNRRFNSETEFWHGNGTRNRLATITQTTPIETTNALLKGRTTLYGELIRIGGDDPPRAFMRFTDGTHLSCRLKNPALARRMAPLLYERIGVSGIAQWDSRDMSLVEMRIDELLPYRQRSLRERFDTLRDLIGDYVEANATADPDDYRGTSEEQTCSWFVWIHRSSGGG